MNRINLCDAKCDNLAFTPRVQFSKHGQTLTGFELEAYTGAIIDRWWGKLALSIDGITAKPQMPIFRDHDHTQIVGYATEHRKTNSFLVKGVFSQSTEAAKEVISLAQEGFPWQASIGVKPVSIVEVEANNSMEVNGLQVVGPAQVWLESEVHETSFVPLGADSSTSVSVFSEVQPGTSKPIFEGNKMGQQQTFEHLPVEERCKIEWSNKPAIRAEFTEYETYLAYMQGVENGSIKETIKSCQSERVTI